MMNDYDPHDSGRFSQDSAEGEIVGMRYLYAFTWVTESKNWMMNVLLSGVCNFIPIIGPLVILGYQYENVENLYRRRNSKCLDFDFGRFVEYLTRGVWPFLAQLIMSIVVVPLIWVIAILPWLLMGPATGGGQPAGGAPMFMVLFFCVMLLIFALAVVLFSFVMLPLTLRAGLSQDFGETFKFGWVVDFVRRMWLEMILTSLLLSAAMMVLVFCGILLCFVGVYFIPMIGMIAYAHLASQLYEVFLSRGGEPIPLKDPPASSPPPIRTPPSQ